MAAPTVDDAAIACFCRSMRRDVELMRERCGGKGPLSSEDALALDIAAHKALRRIALSPGLSLNLVMEQLSLGLDEELVVNIDPTDIPDIADMSVDLRADVSRVAALISKAVRAPYCYPWCFADHNSEGLVLTVRRAAKSLLRAVLEPIDLPGGGTVVAASSDLPGKLSEIAEEAGALVRFALRHSVIPVDMAAIDSVAVLGLGFMGPILKSSIAWAAAGDGNQWRGDPHLSLPFCNPTAATSRGALMQVCAELCCHYIKLAPIFTMLVCSFCRMQLPPRQRRGAPQSFCPRLSTYRSLTAPYGQSFPSVHPFRALRH